METYLVYVRFTPTSPSRWSSCICLNHPVLLTQDINKALEYQHQVSINCDERCRYASCLGRHNYSISKLGNQKRWLTPIEVLRSQIEGNPQVPQLHIYCYEVRGSIKCYWTFDPQEVPEKVGIHYKVNLLPDVYTEVDIWKRPDDDF